MRGPECNVESESACKSRGGIFDGCGTDCIWEPDGIKRCGDFMCLNDVRPYPEVTQTIIGAKTITSNSLAEFCSDGCETEFLNNIKVNTLATTPTKDSCEIRMVITTDGCCIEYSGETMYAVGSGYVDISISSDDRSAVRTGDLKNCCNKFMLNGSLFNGNNISYLAEDGEEISVEPDYSCHCKKLDNQTAKNGFKSQCNSEPLSALGNKPYKIFKNLSNNTYEIIFR